MLRLVLVVLGTQALLQVFHSDHTHLGKTHSYQKKKKTTIKDWSENVMAMDFITFNGAGCSWGFLTLMLIIWKFFKHSHLLGM